MSMQSVEEFIDHVSQPIKPYVPSIARFLLVVTFLEDSLRITWAAFVFLRRGLENGLNPFLSRSTQYGDQKFFLKKHRGFYPAAADIFLVSNVIVMMVCSILAIAKKHTEMAVAGLGLVVVTQGIGYGLIFDSAFFFRGISIVGGLVLLLADAQLTSSKKRNSMFAGLPQIEEISRSTYLQLFGRILLVFLFLGFLFAGKMTLMRAIVAIVAFVGCIMVVVGFKAKWSAGFLILFLSVSNVLLNNWWSLHQLSVVLLFVGFTMIEPVYSTHPQRDFQRYDFFQNLSIMGGFLLLVNLGPGGLSMDEKKKNF
ncbi:hypothetical protein HDU83_006475 [Entophlyctis luteolus]|nr:hypothetical protein HDU83_006475 [Entophlyctis luteolus]